VQANSYWLYIVPWGNNRAVNYVKETYENPTMILAENGTHESKFKFPRKMVYGLVIISVMLLQEWTNLVMSVLLRVCMTQ